MAFDHSAFSTILADFCGIYEQEEKNNAVASTGFLARHDKIIAEVDGYYASTHLDALKGYRKAAVALQKRAKDDLTPLFLAYLDEVVGKPATTINDKSWADIVTHFIDNSYTVFQRAFTRGAVDAGGPENYTNIGSGTAYRQLTDDRNLAIENSDPGIVELWCDKQLGESGVKRYQTEWIVRHRAPAADELGRRAKPVSIPTRLVEAHVDGPGSIVQNGGFDEGSAGTLPSTGLVGWTFAAGTATNNALSATTAEVFRKDTTRTPLSFRANESLTLTQYLDTTKKTFRWDVPYFVAVAFQNAIGSFVGDLTINVGDQTTTVAISAQTGWNWLVGSMTDDRWPRLWQEDRPAIDLIVTRTSGYLFLDTFICEPMTPFDGTYFTVLGGTGADDFAREDRITFTDTISTEKYIQKWVHRAFRRYLPHAASGSVAEPTIG